MSNSRFKKENPLGTNVAHEKREFARIDVVLEARVQPLDADRAEQLKYRLMTQASVWAPSDETTLRDLANSGGGGHDPLLAQAILELTAQIVSLQNQLMAAEGPVKPARLLQLSGGGGRMDCEFAFDEQDLFEIRFDESDGDVPPIQALGRVVHCAGGGSYGFAFEAMHPRDQNVLIRLIYQLQRRALRRSHYED